jgi:hypothetical protein
MPRQVTEDPAPAAHSSSTSSGSRSNVWPASTRQSRASINWKGAEPTQLDALAASQSGSDLVEYRRHDEFSVRRPQMRIAGGEFRDEFCSGQRRLPRGSFSTQSRQRGSMLPGLAANQ